MSEPKNFLERRRFLQLGAASVAAGALAGCATTGVATVPATARASGPTAAPAASATPSAAPSPVAPKPAAANRRILGRTGLEVPVVSMGVMNADNPNLVRAALEGGMVLLDTAHGYQGGRNEEMLGPVLKGRPRDSFVLCTKVFLSTQDRKTGALNPGTRPAELEEKLDISLKRLGLDAVDVFHLHNQSLRESALDPGLLEALTRIKKAGKARFVGLSTHKNEPEAIRAAVEAQVYDVVLTSYNFRQDHHREVEKAMGEAAAAGLGVVVMKTQAGVYWDKDKKLPIDPRAALRWALRVPHAHTAIPGFTTFDQLQADLEVLRDPVITEADLRRLEAPPVVGFYCQGCRSCSGACREGLPVPELMRGYMYAHAYRNREAAFDLVTDLDLPHDPCASCESCAVACPKGFRVRERIADVVRLRDVPREFLT